MSKANHNSSRDTRRKRIHIETEHEPHDGPYPGTHANYHLRSKVTFLDIKGEAA